MNSSTDIIESVFGSSGRIAILRLMSRTTAPLTGRQVAQLTGLTEAGARRALDRLASLGIVSQRRFGSAVVNELVRDNDIVRTIVLPAYEAEAVLAERLQQDLAGTFGEDAVSVVLFGSVARNEAEPGSDIDVLVVSEDSAAANHAEELATEEGARYYRTYGKPLSVIAKTRDELLSRKPAFLGEALRDGVTVAGKPLGEIVGDTERQG